MKHLFILFFSFILVACGGGGEGTTSGGIPGYGITVATEEPSTPSAVDCTVSLYGDSIMYGYIPAGRVAQTPAMTLTKLNPKLVVTDISFPGDGAVRHQGAFLNDPLPSRIIVIQYGINDAGQNTMYEQALRSEVQYAKSKQKIVIVTGLSSAETENPVNRSAYDAIARKVAAEENVTFGDWGSVTPATTADGLHPDQAFSILLATSLVATIGKAAKDCK